MDIKRFLKKVRCNIISRDGNNCWIWQAYKDKDGYGKFWHNEVQIGAHRFAFAFWQQVSLKDMKDKLIMHSCDNPPCVNPSHLKLGTYLDNKQDAVKKRRHAFGESSSKAKLTVPQVKEIKKLFNTDITLVEIAKIFGVTPTSIGLIRSGKNWRHIKA